MALFDFLFKRKKSEPQVVEFPAPKYSGRSPYSSPITEPEFQSIGQRYAGQIGERSQGQGLVGFDPKRRDILRGEFEQDFGDYRTDVLNRASQQASGQGFRGGLPLESRERAERSLARARQSALADIDVQDLTARREDINRATYAQPDLLGQAAGIQQNAAAFDLAKNQFEQPDRRVFAGSEQPSFLEQIGSPLLSAAYLASSLRPPQDTTQSDESIPYATPYYGQSTQGVSIPEILGSNENALAPNSAFQKSVRERKPSTGESLADAGFQAGSTAATAAGHPEIAIALQLANAFLKSRRKQ